MKWNMRQVLIAVCLFGVCGVSVAWAQEVTERERQRMQAAQERAQQAQAELQQALELLAEAQESDEARRRLDVAIRNLQSARSRLGRDSRISAYFEPSDIYVSSSRRGAPQMGVYLNTERRPVTDSIGVLLNSVVDDGPAYEAGLREGDVITVANGEALARSGRGGTSPANKLIRIKDDLEEGDTLHVEYRRGATTHSADIEVRYLDDNTSYAIAFDNFEGQLRDLETGFSVLPRSSGNTLSLSTSFGGQLSLLGMLDVELIELDEELGWYFGVQEGLLIVRAPDDDQEFDLRTGDVIVAVDGREPTSQSQLMRILRSYEEGETMEIELMRQREPITIEVTVPDRDGNFFWRRNGRY